MSTVLTIQSALSGLVAVLLTKSLVTRLRCRDKVRPVFFAATVLGIMVFIPQMLFAAVDVLFMAYAFLTNAVMSNAGFPNWMPVVTPARSFIILSLAGTVLLITFPYGRVDVDTGEDANVAKVEPASDLAPVMSFTEATKVWTAANTMAVARIDQWLSYDRNVAKLLRSPAMRNYSDPATIAAATAMARADKLSREPLRSSMDAAQLHSCATQYQEASRELSDAMDAAVDNAVDAAMSRMTDKQRDLLQTAQRMLAIALNNASSEFEQESAVNRVRVILGQLGITVPEVAMLKIEAPIRLAIKARSAAVV